MLERPRKLENHCGSVADIWGPKPSSGKSHFLVVRSLMLLRPGTSQGGQCVLSTDGDGGWEEYRERRDGVGVVKQQ